MIKRTVAFLIALTVALAFVGCSKPETPQSSGDVEIIIEETIIEGGSSMTQEGSSITQNNASTDSPVSREEPTSSQSSEDTPVSSKTPVTSTNSSTPSQSNSAVSTPSEPETIDIDYEWKSHPEDFKLLAFTFDDGPSSLMQDYVEYFAAFEGAGTFFVNGHRISSNNDYNKMQNAINYGWSIGNHGDNHLVATTGGADGGEATYDQIKADIHNLNKKLETNLKKIDGTPYEVSLYRPPNIKPTANSFKICAEENMAVIWLKHDALDWDATKTYQQRYNVFKNGIGTWQDGDIILCHETKGETYTILEELLPEFYRAGYRFCSITELMELRGISLNAISGELNNADGNNGMVINVVEAATYGKKAN
ncbi:MAG: polysaccharide deacetylase family protein [Clostridia bacterium]|nr:polysaccharide deacetylase family protein [Clostridia bacterium]